MLPPLYTRFFQRCWCFHAFAVLIAIGFGLWASALPSSAQKKTEVDMALILAVDCSSSVNAAEYILQMEGLAQALASQDVVSAISSGPRGRVAIQVVQWAGWQTQHVIVPWTIVSDLVTAHQISSAIVAADRLATGKTSISAAIDFGIYQFANNPFVAARKVIDVSGDGANNSGEELRVARDRAVLSGITINGLAIRTDVKNLDVYFRENLIGGTGSFVIIAEDYEAYGIAIKRKLLKEIKGRPIS